MKTIPAETKDRIRDLYSTSEFNALKAVAPYISESDKAAYSKLLVDSEYDLDMDADEYKNYQKCLTAFFKKYGFEF